MRTLVRTITLIMLVSLSVKGFSQKSSECKFEVDKTNANGKPERKIKTKLNGTDTFYFIISRNDTTYTLTLNFWIAGAIKTVITRGEIVTIKMSGGFDIVLKTTGTTKPVAHYSDQTWSEYSPEYPIRSADIVRLKTVAPISLKLDVGDEKVFWEFNSKDIERIREIIRCILK
ncbi:MAG: hypothetical protein WCL06_09405 [Bacteroidota bacterium]